MAKPRKTRAQKIASTEKRNLFMYSFEPKTSQQVKKTVLPVHTTPVAITTYVKHDIQKTLITSLLLIAAQIILLLLLQHHIIKIPGAAY